MSFSLWLTDSLVLFIMEWNEEVLHPKVSLKYGASFAVVLDWFCKIASIYLTYIIFPFHLLSCEWDFHIYFIRAECDKLVKIIETRVVEFPTTNVPDLCNSAIMEARKWVQEKKTESYSQFDKNHGDISSKLFMQSNVSHYFFPYFGFMTSHYFFPYFVFMTSILIFSYSFNL